MSLKILTFCVLLALSEAVRVLVDDYAYAPRPGKKLKLKKKEEGQDFSKLFGVAGHDFPIYHEFPETSFDCASVPVHPGMYADVETACQGYHVCNDGREGKAGSKFLCTNGTLFNQELFTCDHWYNVDCNAAKHFYQLNADPDQNPYTKDLRKKEAEALYAAQHY